MTALTASPIPRLGVPSAPGIAAAFACAIAIVAVAGCGGSGSPTGSAGTGTGAAGERTSQAPGAKRFVVEFRREADLDGADAMRDWNSRGAFVVRALKETATRAQARALAQIEDAGAGAESLWAANAMIVEGSPSLLARLEKLPGVARVIAEPAYDRVQPQSYQGVPAGDIGPDPWHIREIGANRVWKRGITGRGVVVGTIDTGVQYDHPALVEKYRGRGPNGAFDHNFNWFSPTGRCSNAPCDSGLHGTHTTGTAVGGGGGDGRLPAIGVAPDAKWIAAMGCLPQECLLGDLLKAAQFMLAPTDLQGHGADPGLRPHIVNNSWEIPSDDVAMTRATRALAASGIVAVYAVGDDGPGCHTASSPADLPQVLSVGETDRGRTAYSQSSRGPGLDSATTPELVAPGVDIVSSVPGNGYTFGTGSSMAAPHVSGTLALMMDANPNLKGSAKAASAALATASAIKDATCGGAPSGSPNNVYGYGFVDAAAAVSAASRRK